MDVVGQVLGRLVESNNEQIRRIDPQHSNPRDPSSVPWVAEVIRSSPAIGDEWRSFAARGGRLPLIEDLISEDQGNEGPWRAGLLYHHGSPVRPLADEFPATVAALAAVPGLRSAMFSLLEPDTELPEHSGPNAGVLRFHLGVSCPGGASLRVGNRVEVYRDGEAILFDDTVPHSAWNRGQHDRVTLFCEIERPLPGAAARRNRATQAVISLDGRYRGAAARASAWHRALNR